MDLNVTLTHDLIRANAGTGKTFQLTNRFLALVLRGHSPDTILATTFTRKAASEIRERVFRRLLEAMNSPESALTLGQHTGIQKLTVAQCESALLSLLASQHR
jgi:ATP-dependent exoDNAse (exonuclease V) beta subunit